MRWRGPSGQFLGSVRSRAHLAGAGARAPRRGRREGRHHGRVGLARPFRQARCERSLSPGSSCAGGCAPPGPPLPSCPQPGLSGPGHGLASFPFPRPRGVPGAMAAPWVRRRAEGVRQGAGKLGQRRESASQPPEGGGAGAASAAAAGPAGGGGGGEGLNQDGGRGGEAAAAAAAAIGVSARLAAPTRARAGSRAGPRPAPQARGRVGRRASSAPGE